MIIRSALYVPGDHDRAMAKAFDRGADALIFDLEDGVAPEQKAAARRAITALLSRARLASRRTLALVRINHHLTNYYADDLAMLAACPMDGIMLSKVASTEDVEIATSALAKGNRADLPIWCNIETPEGVCNVAKIASLPLVQGLVAGTNDLANDLRLHRTPGRQELCFALQQIVCAGRAYGKMVLDGTFIDLQDTDGLMAEARQGRAWGFHGKTLIHPNQIDPVHRVFSPSAEEITHAQAVIRAYESAMQGGKAVTLLDGRMIERLHYDRALQLLKLAERP